MSRQLWLPSTYAQCTLLRIGSLKSQCLHPLPMRPQTSMMITRSSVHQSRDYGHRCGRRVELNKVQRVFRASLRAHSLGLRP
ncbi:Protein of unknown function [Pyronema omphalodes CBS 100304]|uniref:Uncharacterized protein n=1 Tax=Pyronema omphalodes (strain CBS 100304) TaxID=1076935 RepID=U4KVE9_PYROM|nr:Protein of unknown function [Pyronema omphalodes CBS 100304]